MISRFVLLSLLSALPCAAANFTFIQSTQTSGTLGTSHAFPSVNTAGNMIIAIVIGTSSGPPAVTDTKGNTYTLISPRIAGGDVQLYAATNIAAGSNTVSTAGTQFGLVAHEYHSANPTYYACQGTYIGGGQISSAGSVNFHSPSEVMVVWGGNITASGGASWTLSGTGAVRFSGVDNTAFGGNATASGDDDVASVSLSPPYGNVIEYSGNSNGSRMCLFLSLTSLSGCTGVTPASHVTGFSIIY